MADDITKETSNIGEILDKDIIDEVGNILMHSSATAFSKLVKESININTEINLISIKDFTMEFIFTQEFSIVFDGISDNVFEGYFLKTTEGAEGISVILFHKKHLDKLVNSVASSMYAGETLDEQTKLEIIKEFSSITINAYLNALGRLINQKIDTSLPIRARDILGSLYDFKLELSKEKQEKALLMKTTITAAETGIEGKLIVLMKPETYKNILAALRKQS